MWQVHPQVDGDGGFGHVGHSQEWIRTTATANDGDWHHVAVTYNAASGAKKILVDGHDVTTETSWTAGPNQFALFDVTGASPLTASTSASDNYVDSPATSNGSGQIFGTFYGGGVSSWSLPPSRWTSPSRSRWR